MLQACDENRDESLIDYVLDISMTFRKEREHFDGRSMEK